MSTKKHTQTSSTHSFKEDPYDIETLIEAIHMASLENKELLFLDKLLTEIKETPSNNTVDVSYRILRELEVLKLEKANN